MKSAEETRQAIGAWVRRRRLEFGWSQAELANLAGVSQSMISKAEAGLVLKNFWNVVDRVAPVFGVSRPEAVEEIDRRRRRARRTARTKP